MSRYNDINYGIENIFRELYEFSRYALARIDEANHELSQRQHILEPQDVLLMYAESSDFRDRIHRGNLQINSDGTIVVGHYVNVEKIEYDLISDLTERAHFIECVEPIEHYLKRYLQYFEETQESGQHYMMRSDYSDFQISIDHNINIDGKNKVLEMESPLPYSFAEAFDALIKKRGTTNEKLAELSGFSSKTISRLRNKDTKPEPSSVVAVCIGLSLDNFLSQELLNRAGCVLSGSTLDRAYSLLLGLAPFITIEEANEMLKKMDLPTLGSQEF